MEQPEAMREAQQLCLLASARVRASVQRAGDACMKVYGGDTSRALAAAAGALGGSAAWELWWSLAVDAAGGQGGSELLRLTALYGLVKVQVCTNDGAGRRGWGGLLDCLRQASN